MCVCELLIYVCAACVYVCGGGSVVLVFAACESVLYVYLIMFMCDCVCEPFSCCFVRICVGVCEGL